MPLGGIYIHIPFCKHKCSYCDFVSFANKPSSNYIDLLIREIDLYSNIKAFSNLFFDTLYIGGGTPSILPAKEIARLIQHLQKSKHLIPESEITLEANPESLNNSNLHQYLESGINRISIGVQSFDPTVLSNSGRIHTPKTAVDSILLAYKAGFRNISIDLMMGLPGENSDTWLRNKSFFSQLPIQHLSSYILDLSPSTLMHKKIAKGELNLPDENSTLRAYTIWLEYLASKGWRHYEISNFSLPSYASKHNMHYWKLDPYAGFGLAATGCLNDIRYTNTRQLTRYHQYVKNKQIPVVHREKINPSKKHIEKIMLGLRLLEIGIPFSLLDSEKLLRAQKWVQLGYLKINKKRLLLTKTGVFFSNAIILSLC